MFRKLAALVLFGLIAAPAAHAEEARLTMAPVEGIFSFTPGQLDLAGQSEVGDFHRTIRRQHDVVGLDVAMDGACLDRSGEGSRYAGGNL